MALSITDKTSDPKSQHLNYSSLIFIEGKWYLGIIF